MWFGIAVPATFTNSMIKYLQSRLALSFRNRLTKHVHRSYLEAKTYYKVINLDSRIENADQYVLLCSRRARVVAGPCVYKDVFFFFSAEYLT